MTTALGMWGVGEVGRFERTLPPKTIAVYDPRYELGLELLRWFHYRYNADFSLEMPKDTPALDELMRSRYRTVFRKQRRYWHILEPIAVDPAIREFKELFKDVLAEIELLK